MSQQSQQIAYVSLLNYFPLLLPRSLLLVSISKYLFDPLWYTLFMLVPFSNTAIVSNDANDANDANSYRCVQMHRKRILISLLLLYSITKSNRTRRLDIYENLLLLLLMYLVIVSSITM